MELSHKKKHDRIYKFSSVDSFLASSFMEGGVYRVKDDGGEIEFFWSGERGARKRSVLVNFGGAVTNRKIKTPPFFSGLGISKEMDLPILSFSDPTLKLDDEINLAWYAGNECQENLPDKIAKILDGLARRLDMKLVLFGGSGGGFACLVVSLYMQCPASILVWNPQTSISKYSKRFVEKYLEVAFPNVKVEDVEGGCLAALENAGVLHRVKKKNFNDRVKIVYLQNLSDAHTQRHCAPFFCGDSLSRVKNRTFLAGGDALLYLGDWGSGHQPPPRKMMSYALCRLAEGAGLDSLVSGLEALGGIEESVSVISVDGYRGWVLEVDKNCNTLSVSIFKEDGVSDGFGCQYAFYLLEEGRRVETRWYEANNQCVFTISEVGRAVEVVGFVKDIFGEKVIIRKAIS